MKKEHLKKIDIQTRQLVNTLFLWNYKAAFKGRWLEFHDFREYTPSDDAKYIDWLVSAREGKTVMRRYQEERELEVLFVLDTSLSMQFWDNKPKRETLEEVFYILWFSALTNGDRIASYILSGTEHQFIPFKKSKWALFHTLKSISDTKPQIAPDTLSLDFLNKKNITHSLTFIITDRFDIDEKSLKIANIKNDIIFVHISDTFENTLQGTGIKTLSDGVSEISINLDDTKKKNIYIQKREQKMQELKMKLLRSGIDSMFIDDTKNPYTTILQLMKQREA